MLKIEQAQKVVDILFRTELKFGEMKSLFEKEFDEETLFHIYFQLSVLFTNHVLGHDQQVQTFYLLLNSEKDLALEENPFYPLFLFIYETRLDFPNEYQPQLLEVISALLAQENIPDFSDFNLEEFSLFRLDNCKAKPHAFIRSNLTESILFENVETDAKNAISYKQLLVEFLSSVPLENEYSAPFIPNVPEILPYSLQEAEATFIECGVRESFLYDSMKSNGVLLFKKSLSAKLNDKEQAELITTLNDSPDIVFNIEDKSLGYLIENNTEIAKLYIKIWSKKHAQVFNSLTTKPASISVIEVIKASYNLPGVPVKFLDDWIMNNIKTLPSLVDRSSFINMSRIFCRFTTYLLDNKARIGSNVKIELKQFSYNLSTKGVDEAKELFRVLKK